jgi:hypothetical protein
MVAVGTPQKGVSSSPSCITLAVGRCKCLISMILQQKGPCFPPVFVELEPGGNLAFSWETRDLITYLYFKILNPLYHHYRT